MPSSTLDFDPSSAALPEGHFVSGKFIAPYKERQIAVFRPSDRQLLGHVPDASSGTVDLAITDVQQAFKVSDWAKQPPRNRARVLYRWAALIEENLINLARPEAVSSMRPVTETCSSDVPFTADATRFFADLADKLGGDVTATRSDSLGFIGSEPYGVVGAITPWNFPLSMCAWKVGPALAAGNAAVLKASELTPFSAMPLAKLAIEAAMPLGIFNVVNGRGATTGAAPTRHRDVSKISFTGSSRGQHAWHPGRRCVCANEEVFDGICR